MADDDHEDQLVFKSVLEEILPTVNLTLFGNSQKLLSELELFTPDLLFLDINMPCMDGKECLKIIKENPAYMKLPIIMYSESGYHLDLAACYTFGATLFLVKASTYQELTKALDLMLKMNWDNPQGITEKHVIGNQFVPFALND